MKAKVESVVIDKEYDSIIVHINNAKTEIVFSKEDDVKKYNGKTVELVKADGKYVIKEIKEIKISEKALKKE